MFPNFLIVGMAKCGTTSLSQYLLQHPEIFISEQKEPRYITSQCTKLPLGGPKDHLVEKWYIKNYEDYLSLFEKAETKAVGEASADTLFYHDKTIPFIKNMFGDPKIIIILRNPVQRAFSAYQHLVRDEREHLSFEKGLEEEPSRIKKNYELIYYYRTAGLYYLPVQAFMENFTSVKVILNENLQNDPQETIPDVFKFLEVDENFKVDFSLKHNLSGIPKIRFLHKALHEKTLLRKAIRPIIRIIYPTKKARIRMVNKLSKSNLSRMSIDPKTKQKLLVYFKPDIEKVGKLLNTDLSDWLK